MRYITRTSLRATDKVLIACDRGAADASQCLIVSKNPHVHWGNPKWERQILSHTNR
jgi:hypothetical protein